MMKSANGNKFKMMKSGGGFDENDNFSLNH